MKYNKYGVSRIDRTKGVGLDIGLISAFIGVSLSIGSDIHTGNRNEIQ